MPESSHKDVNLGVAINPFSNTYVTYMSPSVALDSGILSRNDGSGAIMRIAGSARLALRVLQLLVNISKANPAPQKPAKQKP